MTDKQTLLADAGRKVKPLVWNEWGESGLAFKLKCTMYVICLIDDDWDLSSNTFGNLGYFNTKTEAKAAAQAHHEAAVLDMLEGV